MKFEIYIKEEGSEVPFVEHYDKDIENPEIYGKEVVAYWNRTLKRHEKKREYVGFKIIDNNIDNNNNKSNDNEISKVNEISNKNQITDEDWEIFQKIIERISVDYLVSSSKVVENANNILAQYDFVPLEKNWDNDEMMNNLFY